jgi:uncharacterized protein YndB with AHSA1/START domain
MSQDLIAQATISIAAPKSEVWNALVSPAAIRQYMFGTEVVSTWKKGSPITWEGEWEGKHYKDKGVILENQRETQLRYTHWSPNSGVPDRPENYHTVAIELEDEGDETRVTLTQDNNPTDQDRIHSEKNWGMMLGALKKYLES